MDHPNNVGLDILSDSKVYRTDIDGSLFLKINDGGIAVDIFAP